MTQQRRPYIPASDADYVAPGARQLSTDFNESELMPRTGTLIPECLIPEVEVFLEKGIQVFRTFVGRPVTVISAYRPPRYNQYVGGAPRSFHMWGHVHGDEVRAEAADGGRPGFAIDFVVAGYTSGQVYQIMEGLIRIGAIPEGGLGHYDNFVHYDNRGYKARWRG